MSDQTLCEDSDIEDKSTILIKIEKLFQTLKDRSFTSNSARRETPILRHCSMSEDGSFTSTTARRETPIPINV